MNRYIPALKLGEGAFSAQAGMNRQWITKRLRINSISRTSGDEPCVAITRPGGYSYFPHKRGWTGFVVVAQNEPKLFPAQAGMNRRSRRTWYGKPISHTSIVERRYTFSEFSLLTQFKDVVIISVQTLEIKLLVDSNP